jgi:hypothetical protein
MEYAKEGLYTINHEQYIYAGTYLIEHYPFFCNSNGWLKGEYLNMEGNAGENIVDFIFGRNLFGLPVEQIITLYKLEKGV